MVLAQEYTDKVSGKTDKRPAFQQMFADASRKQFDMILFWSLDRFSREGVLETLQHLQKLTSYGVEWFSFREEYLRSVGCSVMLSCPSWRALPNRSVSGCRSGLSPG